jgi:hypothetical protein
MVSIVYGLGSLTSTLCAWLLFRAYYRTRTNLLFWSAFYFTCFALSNAVLFIDLILLPERDLMIWRTIPTFIGIFGLVFGIISEAVFE